MTPYLQLLQRILDEGNWQDNRTGIRTKAISGAALSFNLQQGFPAVTTRKLPFKTFMGELVAFLRGNTNAGQFRALGSKIWDANANENAAWLANPHRAGVDDLGRVYGAQWRDWQGWRAVAPNSPALQHALSGGWTIRGQLDDGSVMLSRRIDQLRDCLDKLIHQPTDRRILFHAWNPAELDQMALPPCHLLYQFNANVSSRSLSLCLYQRSVDAPLGLVGNIAEAAALLTLFARLTGFTPAYLNWFGGDVHIYENQLDMVNQQLERAPYSPPKLRLNERIPSYAITQQYEPDWLERVEPSDFELEGYQHHPPLTAVMAV
jgi:thymidylate synthase